MLCYCYCLWRTFNHLKRKSILFLTGCECEQLEHDRDTQHPGNQRFVGDVALGIMLSGGHEELRESEAHHHTRRKAAKKADS